MAFDKGKFISDFTQSGMEEAQAELLADRQADMFGQFATKQDLATLRRDINEQTQKTRLLLDDVRVDARKTEARLEGALKVGFAAINQRFSLLVVSNTAVIMMAFAFMAFFSGLKLARFSRFGFNISGAPSKGECQVFRSLAVPNGFA